MILSEIITEIREKYPECAPLTDADIVRKVNVVQNELFRTIQKEITRTVYDILEGVNEYPLGFSFSKVVDVLVNGTEYTYNKLKGNGTTNFYYSIADQSIGIYPVPTEDIGEGLFIYHYKEPIQLTVSNLGAIPQLEKDFHMLLVYGALSDIAKSYRDTDLVEAFTSEFNNLIDRYNEAKNTPDYPTIECVYGGLL